MNGLPVGLVESVCPLPIVDLDSIALPSDGYFLATPKCCSEHFASDSRCKDHYAQLRTLSSGTFKQCPYGLCSMAFDFKGRKCAITAFIPFPRLGGIAEREIAKKLPDYKVAQTKIADMPQIVTDHLTAIHQSEQKLLEMYSVAVHEIRKLNRTVKQNAERLCRRNGIMDLNTAPPEAVKIWKAAEMMSSQFGIIEVLADEALLTLPVSHRCNIHQLIVKCVRIYDNEGGPRIDIVSPPISESDITACEKTFPSLLTTVIENAIKYSTNGTRVIITIRPEPEIYKVSVENQTSFNPEIDDRVFHKGFRSRNARKEVEEGTGMGLYIAKLIADQHRAEISARCWPIVGGQFKVELQLKIPRSR